MLIKGSIYLTCDPTIVSNAPYNNARVIVLADGLQNPLPIDPRLITYGSILLPSYNAIEAEFDNNLALFANLYETELFGVVQDKFIVLLLAMLAKKINVILYIERDEYINLHFKEVLVNHINSMYGILIGDETHKFSYNQAYDSMLISKFYFYDYISGMEFIKSYPINLDIPPFVLSKLVSEFNPYLPVYTMEAFNTYFKNYIINQHNSKEDLKLVLSRG